MVFRHTIITLRTTAAMSQQDVATQINVARATYANMESGQRQPTLPEICALAALYQVAPAALIDGTIAQEQPAKKITFKSEEDLEPREIVKENPQKLREVLLYILSKVGAKPNVGETVIYKLLYFIDFDYYEKYGKSITGLTYVRNHYGPTPKAQTFDGVIEAMKVAKELEVISTDHFKYTQKKYLPIKEASLEHINARELQHIDQELERLADKSATELSSLSHKDIPWLASKDSRPINYQLAMYRTSDTSVKEPEDEL